MVPFESYGTYSYSIYYDRILYSFRDKARCWSKIAIFFIRPAFDATIKGEGSSSRNITLPFGVKKQQEWCGYLTLKSSVTCLAVSTEYRRVTDAQIDNLRRHSPRYA